MLERRRSKFNGLLDPTSNIFGADSLNTDSNTSREVKSPISLAAVSSIPPSCPSDVRDWSTKHVRDWLDANGMSDVAFDFSEQNINGVLLIDMTPEQFHTGSMVWVHSCCCIYITHSLKSNPQLKKLSSFLAEIQRQRKEHATLTPKFTVRVVLPYHLSGNTS